MSKKLVALFLCAILSLLPSCAINPQKDAENTVSESTGSSVAEITQDGDYGKIIVPDIVDTGITPVKIDYGYKSLNRKDLRTCYSKIKNAVYFISKEKSESGFYTCKAISFMSKTCSEADLRLVITAFKQDNPLVFWISDTFGYAKKTDSITFQLYSEESFEVISQKLQTVCSSLNEAVSSISSSLSEFDREVQIHDYILDNCEYNREVSTSSDHYEAFTVYGVLAEHRAVCEGYAKTFQLMLSLFGIDSRIIMGRGEKELHMWNAVCIDEKWYFVDPSWDDSDDYSRYDYFNIDEEHLSIDHKTAGLFADYTEEEICGIGMEIQAFNIEVPKCTTMNDNYYVKKGSELSSLDDYYDQFIEQDLYDAVENGETYFYIYINPDFLDYDLTVEKLFYTGTRKFFTYVNEVNSWLVYQNIDKNNLSIVKKKNLSVVTVKLSY